MAIFADDQDEGNKEPALPIRGGLEDECRTPEGFVSADIAAEFLGIKRRMLLTLARRGIAGAYPIGTGAIRKTWVFRLSELGGAIDNLPNKPRYDSR